MSKNVNEVIATCTNCGKEIETVPCSFCGSLNMTFNKSLEASIDVHLKTGLKVKEKGVKKHTLETISGDDFSRSKQKFVSLERTIDRKNGLYHELVKDKETGEIIHTCDEPLPLHIGHGHTGRVCDKGNKSDK